MKTKKAELNIYCIEPPNPKGYCRVTGEVLGYYFLAKVYPLPAFLDPRFELGRSRISKLEICEFWGDEFLVNYDCGWDILPKSEDLERAVEIVYRRLAKEVFPSWPLRGIRLMVKRMKRFLVKHDIGFC
jgi:hypothetical protein